MGANVTGKVLMNVVSDVTTVNRWDADAQLGDTLFTGTSEVHKGRPGITGANVLIDKAVITNQPGNKGIGHFLLNNLISSAETVAFDNFITKSLTSNSTDITGSVATLAGARTFTGNVYAIWNSGQHAGDIANANSFALIANVINSNAIELGNVYHPVTNAATSAYRFFQTSNSMQNVTQNVATYSVVNLAQFLDVPSTSFLGDPGVVSTNLEFRLSTGNVWVGINDHLLIGSNGNVNVQQFVNFNVASGFLQAQTSDQKFRYLQTRLQVNNRAPASNDFSLDDINYTIDLKDKKFLQRKDFIPTKGPTVNFNNDGLGFNYTTTDFKQNPLVTVTVSNTRVGIIAVVSNVSPTAANVNLYFAANGVPVTDTNYPGKDRGTAALAAIMVGKVTLEATGI